MSVLRPVTLPPGAGTFRITRQIEPDLRYVPIAELVVDDSYQRELGKTGWRKVKQIAQEFRWSRFTPVLVARLAEGRFAIVDGQHRVHAALWCGIDAVPCQVVEADQAEQARAFAWVNGQVTAVTSFHLYKAALSAGEDWAVRMQRAVEAAGCRLMPHNSSTKSKKAGEVYAHGLLRQYLDAGHGQLITDALAAVREGQAGTSPLAYTAAVLRPWFAGCAEFEADAAALTRFTQLHDLVAVVDRAHGLRGRPEYAHQSREAIARSVLTMLLRRHLAGEATS